MINLFRSSSNVVAADPCPDEPTSSCKYVTQEKNDFENADASGNDADRSIDDTIRGKDIIEEIGVESEHDNVCDGPPHSSLDAEQSVHDLEEGDHIVRWIMLGYCYPVQVHGIVLSVGPELITIVDCGLTVVKNDKAGTFDDEGKISSSWMKTRRRMNILTLVDEKDIKKWKKVHYGEEYKLSVHPTVSEEPQLDDTEGMYPDLEYERESIPPATGDIQEDDTRTASECEQSIVTQSPRKSLFWPFCSTESAGSKLLEDSKHDLIQETANKKPQLQQQQLQIQSPPSEIRSNTFRLPKSDPPVLTLARLRFLLEKGEGDDTCNSHDHDTSKSRTPLLPPHHIFYANSECIAVWIKTGHWSTLQAAVFLHSSTIGNVKQTATLAMYLSAQTVTIPAAGIWGFFGGTTTISLFSAQPWIVPALVGGGVLYAGLPTMLLWKAKSRWLETERRLNEAFWENVDSSVIVNLIQTWSGLEC